MNKYNIEVGDSIVIITPFLVSKITNEGIWFNDQHLRNKYPTWSLEYTNNNLDRNSWKLIKATEQETNMKFKVGDKVKANGTHSYAGITKDSVYVVTQANEKHIGFVCNTLTNAYSGDVAEGLKTNWGVSGFELVEDKIEVGDTVELLKLQNSGLKVGNHYEVTGESDSAYLIKVGTEPTWYFDKEGSLKLISKANKMKEVTGYNIKPEFMHINNSIRYVLNQGALGRDVHFTTFIVEPAKKLGVLELWFEPVYKSSEVVVQLSGNRTATLKDKQQATITLADDTKVPVTALNVSYTLKALAGLGQIAGYNVSIKEFQLGCQTFTIKDLEAVNKAFTDFK